MDEIVAQLKEAAQARKCWACGCLHNSLRIIQQALPKELWSAELSKAVQVLQSCLEPVELECRECEICFPALALNALSERADEHTLASGVCPAEDVTPRDGWPPLPGNYTVLAYRKPIAVCTLNSPELVEGIVAKTPSHVAVVGTVRTENLGIERLIQNVLANPSIRFLIVCGEDSRRKIGHLPGQSMIALAQSGLNERARIIGARGKRPVLRNIEPQAIEHFRRTVEVVNLVGNTEASEILSTVNNLATRNPGPAPLYDAKRIIKPIRGYVPERMVSDSKGYFVVYADMENRLISLEHYRNDGLLTTVIEGCTAAEVYYPVIVKGLISRLDHACYLGRELARAERALLSGEPYVQDAAPGTAIDSVPSGCNDTPGCAPICKPHITTRRAHKERLNNE